MLYIFPCLFLNANEFFHSNFCLFHIELPKLCRECPLDLKEAISSVCFAAPRCADLTELLQVQLLFAEKYGKNFVSAATELLPNCGVNRQVHRISRLYLID